MIERILEFMKIKNLTSSQLADNLGVQRSGISHFVSGRNKPSLEFILKILSHYPEINPDWLLFGSQPLFREGRSANLDEGILTLNQETDESIGGSSQERTQSSLLDDLFRSEPELADTDAPVYESPGIQHDKNPLKSGRKEAKQDKILENMAVEEKVGEIHTHSPERIILFFGDRSFREYHPEK